MIYHPSMISASKATLNQNNLKILGTKVMKNLKNLRKKFCEFPLRVLIGAVIINMFLATQCAKDCSPHNVGVNTGGRDYVCHNPCHMWLAHALKRACTRRYLKVCALIFFKF